MALGCACSLSSGDSDSRTNKQRDQQNVMAASQVSTSRDSLLFPLQFTYTDDGLERLSDANASDQYDPILELHKIQRVLGGLSDAEQQLSAAVQEAKASSILSTGSVDLRSVGSYLRSKHGYLVALRKANISKRPKAYLRQLRHDFLVVRGLPTIEGLDILVDVNFRDHFRVAHATPWYSKMLAALPQDWVGSAQALAPLVGLMSAGIRLCFRQAGIPLPPWREGRAMLSKWITELHTDEPLPIVPLPDAALRRLLAPYHTPFRAAVRQAGAPAAAPPAGAGGFGKASQQQQPVHHSGQGFNPAALPPLPPCTAGAAAAAAAKLAQQQQQQQHADDSGHCAHHHLVPDVPRKIILGFPVASPPPADLQQQLARGLNEGVVMTAPAAAARTAHNAAVQQQQQQEQQQPLAPMQVQQHTGTPQQQPQMRRSSNQGMTTQPNAVSAQGQQQRAAAASGTCAGAPACPEAAAAAAVVSRPGPAVARVDPSALQNSNASNQLAARPAAASIAGTASNGRATSPPAAPTVARPAFASTAGVVVATAGGTSPGIVVNKQWVQQLTEGVIAGSSADKGKSLAPVATATAAAGAVVVDSSGSHEASQGAAAAATAAAVRQYKSLDQLLPRMRTVKLGAG